jgi:HPt (histidine-containing phosphotransfer) domain-containing protein
MESLELPRQVDAGLAGRNVRREPAGPAPAASEADLPERNTMPDQEPFDLAAALQRVEGDVELLAELAEMFIEEHQSMSSEILESIEQGDSEAVTRSAHSLKGSVGNFNARGAFEAALAIETAGRSGDVETARQQYDVLQAELQRLVPALQKLAAEPNAHAQ